VTLWLEGIAPAAIPTNALLLPAETVTEAGAVTPAPVGVTVIATGAPPAGAAAESETTQVAPAPELMEVTGQLSDQTLVGAVVISEIEAEADDPFSDAVRVAVEFAVNAPVLIVNEVLPAPWAMVTDAGAVSAAELEASVTVAPPAPATLLRKTRQFV
jgi:hypothetical protein